MKLLTGIVVVLFGLLLWKTMPETIQDVSDVQMLRHLYTAVNDTRPSSVNAGENVAIIQDRLACYRQRSDYKWRYDICTTRYIEALVAQGRATLQSRPDVGNFVTLVALCPVMYNMCRLSARGATAERCVQFERQCIDYAFDFSWRGSGKRGEWGVEAEQVGGRP